MFRFTSEVSAIIDTILNTSFGPCVQLRLKAASLTMHLRLTLLLDSMLRAFLD